MEERKSKKQRIYLSIGIVLFLILVLSASYAYFQITSVNNATPTTVTGTGDTIGTPTLTTNTPSLGLSLTAEMMNKENWGNRIYASPNGKGINIDNYDYDTGIEYEYDDLVTLGNGRYELATASLDKGVSLDCVASYDISATATKVIEDDGYTIKFVIINSDGVKTEYDYDDLFRGRTYTTRITDLTAGTPQKIYMESYVENGRRPQNDLPGNTYTITVTPKSGTNGFKCNVALSERIINKNAAEFIVANYNTIDNVWKSGYESDGYRYIGIGKYNNIDNPHNFVCFGTTNKSTCTSNPDKYMYRIIGAFQEENGNGTINANSPYHLKLLKKSSIGAYPYHSTSTSVTWPESDLYKGITNSYFYTNPTYDYMQNATWRGKIVDWNWTSVKTDSSYGYGGMWTTEVLKNNYLHELNRSAKPASTASWSYVNAKIGLMNASDYFLANGNMLSDFRSRWIHGFQNDELADTVDDTKHSDRYMSSANDGYSYTSLGTGLAAWSQTSSYGIRPVFYLDSSIQFSSGSGTYQNPFIIK